MDSYHQNDIQIQLHGFFDGSGKADAAVAYLLVFTPDEIFVNLIYGKTKVNPIKPSTLTLIDLGSALLLLKF